MKFFIIALFAILWTLPAGAVVLDYPLPSKRTMNILCTLGLEESLCDPLKRLEAAEVELRRAWQQGEEERVSLNMQLREAYVSEVNPYIKRSCAVGTDSKITLMVSLCASLRQLEVSESGLRTAWQDHQPAQVPIHAAAFSSQQTGIRFQTIGMDAGSQFQLALAEYADTKEDVMKGLCNMGQAPTTEFCNLQKAISEHNRTYYRRAELDFKNAIGDLRNTIDGICERERENSSYVAVLYRDALCDSEVEPRPVIRLEIPIQLDDTEIRSIYFDEDPPVELDESPAPVRSDRQPPFLTDPDEELALGG